MQFERSDKWDYETIEHLVPRSKGGSNRIENLALAHKKCNYARGVQEREPLIRRVAKLDA